jgi:hypothetical protein
LIPVEEEKYGPTEQTNTVTFLLKLIYVGLGQLEWAGLRE